MSEVDFIERVPRSRALDRSIELSTSCAWSRNVFDLVGFCSLYAEKTNNTLAALRARDAFCVRSEKIYGNPVGLQDSQKLQQPEVVVRNINSDRRVDAGVLNLF